MAQNEQSTGYDQAKIDALDQQWRAEVDAATKPLIDATLSTEASKYLATAQADSRKLVPTTKATISSPLFIPGLTACWLPFQTFLR